LLLSELQGDYSFVLFDSERRVAFAARDPTGGEPLFYSSDDGGGVVITNSTEHVAAGALEDVELGDTPWQVC
jgi:asparagine synthetase B (glutamine-hydrolysing)